MYKPLFIILCLLLAVTSLYADGTVGFDYRIEFHEIESKRAEHSYSSTGQLMSFGLYSDAYLGDGFCTYGFDYGLSVSLPFNPGAGDFFNTSMIGVGLQFGLSLRLTFSEIAAITLSAGYDYRLIETSLEYFDFVGQPFEGRFRFQEHGIYGKAMARFSFSNFLVGLGVSVSSPIMRSEDFPWNYVIDDRTFSTKGLRIASSLVIGCTF